MNTILTEFEVIDFLKSKFCCGTIFPLRIIRLFFLRQNLNLIFLIVKPENGAQKMVKSVNKTQQLIYWTTLSRCKKKCNMLTKFDELLVNKLGDKYKTLKSYFFFRFLTELKCLYRAERSECRFNRAKMLIPYRAKWM